MSSYLNDKSNNDYQLINEISKVIKEYKNKNLRVDRHFVDKVVDTLLINDSLDISKTGFASGDYGGYYSFNEKRLYLNFQLLQNFRKYYKPAQLKDGNLYEYYIFLVAIIHEFTHAKQYSIMYSPQCESSGLYRYSDTFLQSRTDLYHLHHDTVPYERYANIRSEYLTIEILKRLYSLEELWCFQGEFIYELLYDYDDQGLYPLKKFDELVESNSLPTFSHLIPKIDICDDNLYERLNIGLPITQEEYNYLKDFVLKYFVSKEEYKNEKSTITNTLAKIIKKA